MMFVPNRVYEVAPFYWVVLGIALIGVGAYVGAMGDQLYLVTGIGSGVISCLWGLRVFRKRLKSEVRRSCSTYDDYLDQTCELNLQANPIAQQPQGETRS
jgi:hypothetical protein